MEIKINSFNEMQTHVPIQFLNKNFLSAAYYQNETSCFAGTSLWLLFVFKTKQRDENLKKFSFLFSSNFHFYLFLSFIIQFSVSLLFKHFALRLKKYLIPFVVEWEIFVNENTPTE